MKSFFFHELIAYAFLKYLLQNNYDHKVNNWSHKLGMYRVRHKSWYGISNGCGTKMGQARSTKILFLQLFTIVFSRFFENLEILALRNLHLWYQIWPKISLKKGVFGTPDIFIEISLELHKKCWKIAIKSLLNKFWVSFVKYLNASSKSHQNH